MDKGGSGDKSPEAIQPGTTALPALREVDADTACVDIMDWMEMIDGPMSDLSDSSATWWKQVTTEAHKAYSTWSLSSLLERLAVAPDVTGLEDGKYSRLNSRAAAMIMTAIHDTVRQEVALSVAGAATTMVHQVPSREQEPSAAPSDLKDVLADVGKFLKAMQAGSLKAFRVQGGDQKGKRDCDEIAEEIQAQTPKKTEVPDGVLFSRSCEEISEEIQAQMLKKTEAKESVFYARMIKVKVNNNCPEVAACDALAMIRELEMTQVNALNKHVDTLKARSDSSTWTRRAANEDDEGTVWSRRLRARIVVDKKGYEDVAHLQAPGYGGDCGFSRWVEEEELVLGIKLTKLSRERQAWKDHLTNDHQPYRSDCAVCINAQASGDQHRRRRHPHLYTVGLDVAGPFVTRGRDMDYDDYKYMLVASYRCPKDYLSSKSIPDSDAELYVPDDEEDDFPEDPMNVECEEAPEKGEEVDLETEDEREESGPKTLDEEVGDLTKPVETRKFSFSYDKVAYMWARSIQKCLSQGLAYGNASRHLLVVVKVFSPQPVVYVPSSTLWM
ncbi:hypothetical protein AK812_SmicGene7008 [Symbiodinium microadriaticum]|uniref:Uncharacterized protein n=1 Tax=Symbiodinium microadriaticum TaxID=2951 RepID=A0A1Q9EPW3_SYMMI|nr:hypothetical protein AK812_SmicGene7008 [Symbiodinium microadriaticum]CAE7921355.1 unnamed protein product [Symbiodinium sp. KB8]